MTKYPKFNREENRSCKLSDEEIKQIRSDYRVCVDQGVPKMKAYKEIGKKYKVHYNTIRYWCDPKVKERTIKTSIKRLKNASEEEKEKWRKRANERKREYKERKGDDWWKYQNGYNKMWYKIVREYIKKNHEDFRKYYDQRVKELKDTYIGD